MWTLVQHSGFLVGGKDGFERAVEVQAVPRRGDQTKVTKAGGMLFESYALADAAEYGVNYPLHAGLYPHVEGTFGIKISDGRPVYIPSGGDRIRLGLEAA